MKEQKMTDEQLSQELNKSKGGRIGGKLLSLLGGAVILFGIILGGNMALIIIGAVLMGLGQMTQGKAGDKANKQAYDTIVPEIVGNIFTNIANGYRYLIFWMQKIRIFRCPVIVTAVAADTSGEHIMD